MFLLDTSVLSELRKVGSGRADAKVAAWSAAVHPNRTFISAISVLELERGILQVERRDRVQAMLLRRWLDEHVLPVFASRVLAVDTTVAQRCAGLHVPNPRPERDALIAATALVHGMTVVTRNVPDFESTGVSVMNPWTWDSAR